MSPGAHLLMSWTFSSTIKWSRRERFLITMAGISPDIDGAGWVIDKINLLIGKNTDFYGEFHHILSHNLIFAIIVSAICLYFAKAKKIYVALFAFIAVHLHILADLVGSKGPDGHSWPMDYLYPFSSELMLSWDGQWELVSWQNFLTMLILIIISIYIAVTRKYSPFEIFSKRLDESVFEMSASVKQLFSFKKK